LEELFRPQIILVNFVNHLQTLSFLFIHPRIELSYEVEEFLFSVLNPFTVDVGQIIELND
jgi:Holliday junction resolvasome RuvABC ATP-dependent DNA helicase subunit